jgi:hypothetical protein
MTIKITEGPDQIDFERVEKEHGPLPPNASIEEQARRYNLAVSSMVLRLYEQGRLPLAMMREIDGLRKRKGGAR